MRMSLRPRPVASAQKKRPSVVIAPPVSKSPRRVIFPTGFNFRPVGWMWFFGPIRPPPPGAETATAIAAIASSASSATGTRIFARLIGGSVSRQAKALQRGLLVRVGDQAEQLPVPVPGVPGHRLAHLVAAAADGAEGAEDEHPVSRL